MIITNHPAQSLLNQPQKTNSVNKVGNCRHYSPFSLVCVCLLIYVYMYILPSPYWSREISGCLLMVVHTNKKGLVIEEIALKSLSLESLTSCNQSLTCA